MRLTRAKWRDDIRVIFDDLCDDVLLDDHQVALLAGRSTPTIKRWRRDGKTPSIVMLNGLPRYRVGDIRAWLRGEVAKVA
jgi:predicted DNA-binding transcriptional regulator AlpA